MKKLLMGLLVLSSLTMFTSCSDGNGSGSPGGPGVRSLDHNDLADYFVDSLNLDPEFSVQLVKSSTLQADFIVIYDPQTDSYDAINIDHYNPNTTNAADYYFANSARNVFDLDIIPARYEIELRYEFIGYDAWGNSVYDYVAYEVYIPTRYRDRYSGLTFEKIKGSTKDLAKVTALKEAASVKKTADFISSEFGLSMERATEVAGLKAHWKKAGVKGMTASEIDSFSTELLGFSLTKGIEAYKSSVEGNSSSLDSLVNEAAAVNGITPEHAGKLMTKVFGL